MKKFFIKRISVLSVLALFCIPVSIHAQDGKISTLEAQYTATSFEDVKLSGSYGLAYTILPWEIASSLYVGFHLSPFNFNFGLVDTQVASGIVKLGPALGYRFSSLFCIAMPVSVVCNIYSIDKKTKTAWGMECSPSLYVGKRFGVFAGPSMFMGFQGNAKVNFGFRAGIFVSI